MSWQFEEKGGWRKEDRKISNLFQFQGAQLTFTVDINASLRQPFSLVGMVTNHAISHWSCGEQQVTAGRAGNRQVLCVLALTRYRERDERPLFFLSAIHIAHLTVTVYSRSLITSCPPVMNKAKNSVIKVSVIMDRQNEMLRKVISG